jgi:uncharacterized caspase-like protein
MITYDTCFRISDNKRKANLVLNSELSELIENKNKKAQDLKQQENSTEKDKEVNNQKPKRIKLDLWGFIKEQQDERFFSKAGLIKNDLRNRIAPENLNAVIFLSHNYTKIKK